MPLAKAWHFPFLLELLSVGDKGIHAEYVGTADVLGELADEVRIWREPDPSDPANFMVVRYGARMRVWLSQTTGVPLKIEYLKQGPGRLSFDRRTRLLSDYRPIDGVLMPFHEEEWQDSEKLWEVQFDSVQFNIALTPSDFPVSVGGQE
jgi:hypothetical protein